MPMSPGILPVEVILGVLAVQDMKDRAAGCREITVLGVVCAAEPFSAGLVLLAQKSGLIRRILPVSSASRSWLAYPGTSPGADELLLLVLCMLPGILLYALSLLPDMPAGEGDGMVVLALGLALRPAVLFRILAGGQFFAAGWAVRVLWKKAGKQSVERQKRTEKMENEKEKLWIIPSKTEQAVQKPTIQTQKTEKIRYAIPENAEGEHDADYVPFLTCLFAAALLALPCELYS